MADFRINVIVDPSNARRGTRDVRRELDRTSDTADRLRNTLQRAFALIGIGTVITQLVQLTDSFTNIQNRLRTVTTGVEELNVVTQELFEISQRTRASFEGTAEVFARVGLAVRELGLSQQQTLEFTESLNQAVALSGASTIEATAGLIQLSQGLASGRLNGDELRSVLEQLPVVADVIAQQLGVTRGELRALGSQGQITADQVIEAFASAREELAGRFAQTIPTIGQSFTVLRNSLIQTVASIDQATGASATFAQSILFLANNMETLVRAVGAVSGALAVTFAVRGVGVAITAVQALTLAIAANPIGAIAIGITATVSALTAFSDQITVTSDGLVTLQDAGLATFDILLESLTPVLETFQTGFNDAISSAVEAFADLGITYDDVISATGTFINTYIGTFVGLGRAIQSIFSDVRDIVLDAIGPEVITVVTEGFSSFITFLSNSFETIRGFVIETLNLANTAVSSIAEQIGDIDLPDDEIVDTFRNIGENASEAFLSGYNQDFIGELESSILPVINRIEERARELAEQRRIEASQRQAEADAATAVLAVPGTPRTPGVSRDLQQVIDLLNRQNEALRLSNQERQIQNQIIQIEERLRRTLTDSERELLEATLLNNQSLQVRANVLQEIRGPQEEFAQTQQALNELLAEGTISLDEFNQAMSAARLQSLQADRDFASGIERAFIRISDQALDSATAIENVFVSAFDGLTNVLADFITTGEADFRGFATAIVNELIRISIQALLVRALTGGTTGGALPGFQNGGSFTVPGFQNGGSFNVGGAGGIDNQLVAFRASPGERVTVETRQQQQSEQNEQRRGTQQEQVGIRIVNVTDPNMLADFLTSPAGERTLINTIQRNAASINSVLGS